MEETETNTYDKLVEQFTNVFFEIIEKRDIKNNKDFIIETEKMVIDKLRESNITKDITKRLRNLNSEEYDNLKEEKLVLKGYEYAARLTLTEEQIQNIKKILYLINPLSNKYEKQLSNSVLSVKTNKCYELYIYLYNQLAEKKLLVMISNPVDQINFEIIEHYFKKHIKEEQNYMISDEYTNIITTMETVLEKSYFENFEKQSFLKKDLRTPNACLNAIH